MENEQRKREQSRDRMRRWRKTEKGIEYVRRYNLRYKRPDVEKFCIHCSTAFKTARKNQELCSNCSLNQNLGRMYAMRRYKAKPANKKKIYARGVFRRKKAEGQCEICRQEAENHHPDYDKPKAVIRLCKKHHALTHFLEKK